MPNTQVPPKGTFSDYYREVDTHEWYTTLTLETRFGLEKIILITAGWGVCSCGTGSPMFQQEIHVGEGAYTLTNARCKKCIRQKALENVITTSDFETLYQSHADYSTSSLYNLLMPYGSYPKHTNTRDICEVCSGYMFEAYDLGVTERSTLITVAQDDNGDEYIVHSHCSFNCECDKKMIQSHVYNKVDGNPVCEECFNAYDVSGDLGTCGWCDGYFTDTHWSDLRDQRLCTRCFDSSWDCEDCGHDMYENDEHECYLPRDSIIYEYNYKPDPVFFGSDTYYFGLELEVEDNGGWGCESGAQIVKDALGSRIYLKRDGSLENGFEIVSHPHTFAEWQTINWNFLRSLRSKGFRSWDTETCGIHVHISRTAFRKGGQRDEAHELRFQKLIYDNGVQVRAIAGRSSQYARFNDKGALVPKVKYGHTADRYEAINSQNDHTLEVRVFRGSLKPQRVLSAIEFLHSAIEYTRYMKIDPKDRQLGWIRFMGYVLDNKDKYENFAQIASSTLDNTREFESEEM